MGNTVCICCLVGRPATTPDAESWPPSTTAGMNTVARDDVYGSPCPKEATALVSYWPLYRSSPAGLRPRDRSTFSQSQGSSRNLEFHNNQDK